MKRFAIYLAAMCAGCVPPESEAPAHVPSASRLTVECARRSVFAWSSDRSMREGGSVACTVFVADRFGQQLDGVSVSLSSEAGTLMPAEGITVAGKFATELFVSAPAPRDVEPGMFGPPMTGPRFTGSPLAPAWMRPNAWVQSPLSALNAFPIPNAGEEPRRPDPLRPGIINNPRDNLVTLIAVVQGEEAFSDDNANAFREPSETFVDLTEPFVDADDDGTRTDGEFFVDANANGEWDGKNDAWDSATKIWSTASVLWTGVPNAADMEFGGTSVVVGSPTLHVDVPRQGTGGAAIMISDPWFNAITRVENDVCELSTTDPLVVFASRTLGAPYQQEQMSPAVHFVEVHDTHPQGMNLSQLPVRLTCRSLVEPVRSFSAEVFRVRSL